ncbi:Type III restriction-modification system: methylase [[Mycoplasma] cavipharyngis]
MNERLILAKQLLKENGLIFVSIDDREFAYLKVLMDEIFDELNYLGTIKWRKTNSPSGNTNQHQSFLNVQHEYILIYAKNLVAIETLNTKERSTSTYKLKDQYFDQRGYYKLTPLWHSNSGSSFAYSKSLDYPLTAPDGTVFYLWQNQNRKDIDKWCYTWSEKTAIAGNKLGFLAFKKNKNNNQWEAYRKVYTKCFFDPKKHLIVYRDSIRQEFSDYYDPSTELDTFNQNIDYYCESTTQTSATDLKNLDIFFSFSKPYKLIKHLINLHPNKNARVLDFFAGSGTTGHAVLDLNQDDGGKRSFYLVTNNENNIATDITYERLYRINFAKGTKNETFKWANKNQAYQSNLKVLTVQTFPVDLTTTEININDQLINLFQDCLKVFEININLSKQQILEKLFFLTSLKNNLEFE